MVDLRQCRITWKGGLSEQLSRLAWSGLRACLCLSYMHSWVGSHMPNVDIIEPHLQIHHILLLTVLGLVLSGSCRYALPTFVRVFLSTTT